MPLALGATGLFLVIDAVLAASCLLKFAQGGWFPLALGLALFVVMATWWQGRALMGAQLRAGGPQLVPFVTSLVADPTIPRSQRTAVYPTAHPDHVPAALLHNLKHYQVLHACNVILTVRFLEVPWVPADQRVESSRLPGDFWRVQVAYGFKDQPDIPAALELCFPYRCVGCKCLRAVS